MVGVLKMVSRKKRSKKKILGLIIIAIIVLALIMAAAIVLPILTHQSAGSSGQQKPAGFTDTVSATGQDGRTRELTVFDGGGRSADLSKLNPGDELILRGTGYNTNIGIYVGFCKVPDSPDMKPGPCLGGIPEDAQQEKDRESIGALESAWVTNNWAWRSFASHSYESDGSFEVLLRVPEAKSEGVDCTVDECGLYTRADHTALKDRVQDIYLPVGF